MKFLTPFSRVILCIFLKLLIFFQSALTATEMSLRIPPFLKIHIALRHLLQKSIVYHGILHVEPALGTSRLRPVTATGCRTLLRGAIARLRTTYVQNGACLRISLTDRQALFHGSVYRHIP